MKASAEWFLPESPLGKGNACLLDFPLDLRTIQLGRGRGAAAKERGEQSDVVHAPSLRRAGANGLAKRVLGGQATDPFSQNKPNHTQHTGRNQKEQRKLTTNVCRAGG